MVEVGVQGDRGGRGLKVDGLAIIASVQLAVNVGLKVSRCCPVPERPQHVVHYW
jgi:hypothetical protein